MLIHLNRHRFSRLVGLAMVALTTMLFSFPAAAIGDGRSPAHRIGRHGHPVRIDGRAAHFRPGRVHVGHHVVRSPRRHTRIRVGAFPYFFHSGRYYRPARRGYARVGPPVGAIFAALPLGFLTLTLGSSLYYSHGDVYYRPVAAGYMVVDPPREVVRREVPTAPLAAGDDRVVVTAPRLNVRSGPGRGYAVIAVIDRGASLGVAGSAPDWLYVDLGDGRHGWVQQTYTVALSASANG
jgi:hypothetical protein